MDGRLSESEGLYLPLNLSLDLMQQMMDMVTTTMRITATMADMIMANISGSERDEDALVTGNWSSGSGSKVSQYIPTVATQNKIELNCTLFINNSFFGMN